MATFSSLGVFCGSASGNIPEIAADAGKLGRFLAQKNIRLVYGAGGDGLMGAVAGACMNAGGYVLGLSDSELAPMEKEHLPLTEVRVFTNLAARKEALFAESDAFCVFAGGLGTLDELANVIVLKQIGFLNKPIVFYNRFGVWEPFRTMVGALVEKGFVRPKDASLFSFADSVEDVFAVLEQEKTI